MLRKGTEEALSFRKRIKEKNSMPFRMKLVNGRWFSNVRDKRDWGKIHCVSLDAYEHEQEKALIKLGDVLRDILQGVDPVSARKQVSKLKIKTPSKRAKQVLAQHIYPFFGKYKPREVTKELIESYVEHRFGLSGRGELRGVKSTLDKELNVLQSLLKTVDPNYKKPKMIYRKIRRDILDPLLEEQISFVSESLGAKYIPVYWIMAYTAMDVSDAVLIRGRDFTKDGWIDKPRGKVEDIDGERIVVPVLPALAEILKSVPRPIDPEARLFPDINPKATTTAILRAFKVSGLPGYGAKYLRRYIGSALCDEGYPEELIGKILSHADGSKVTGRYTQIYKTRVQEAFNKLGQRGKNVEKGFSKNG